ncbi:hypothetical protein [Aquicoccus porphyridii]|uniref:hypothetical protein n=1 Tax=Aquicoccus porphyridii TaxID=1852029 RepID=UPI0011B94213|nr:hypothetical protein [Aquicoccus porphyridii]
MNWTSIRALIVAFSAVAGTADAIRAHEPLSAIEWLENPPPVVRRVVPGTGGIQGPRPIEPPVTDTAAVPQVTVSPLDRVSVAAVGLLPASVTGLPRDLWRSSATTSLTAALARQDVLAFPAMQSLLYTLLLAEADPPADSGSGHAFLKGRISKLLELGAAEAAQALLERTGPETPALFPLWFDISLLSGTEEAACNSLNEKPFLSPSVPARIYCAARGGDWAAAAVMFDSAVALDMIDATERHLIAIYLDPELAETNVEPAPPAKMTPLVFRLFEAAGTPLPTLSLPRVYAMTDLRDTVGWKAELEAAERLTRTGALSENRLMALYTARRPAASGGIWDRVEAIRRFDAALQSGNAEAVATSLGRAWRAMQSVHLEVPFARFYAKDLTQVPLTGPARGLALSVGLLSPDYEMIAAAADPQTPDERFLVALARGEPRSTLARDPLLRTIARAFEAEGPPEALQPLLETGKLGEAILQAMTLFSSGASGNLGQLESALQGLRAMGLEDSARRASLQLILLNQGELQ